MGNVRVWIQDLWGGGGGKANDLQSPFQINSTTNSDEGKEMHTATSAPLDTPPCWYPQALKGKSFSSLCQMSSPELSQGIQA